MWRGVVVAQRPSALPISLEKIKARLAIDHNDHDDMIGDLIKGAVALIDGPSGIGIALMRQSWRKSMDYLGNCITLPGWPIKAISSVTYLDENGTQQTLSPLLYQVDLDQEPVRILPAWNASWPNSRKIQGSVKVTYALGEESPTDIPADLIDAVAMLVAYRYERREAAGDAATEIPFGVSSILTEHRRAYF
jgi:uncharacterized phiE125 gp8 family phage protein